MNYEEFFQSRIDHLAEPQRKLARGLVHGGHVATGFLVAALTLKFAPVLVALLLTLVWIAGAEFYDTKKYSDRYWPWSKDSWMDASQIFAGGLVAVTPHPLVWPLILILVGVYFYFCKKIS